MIVLSTVTRVQTCTLSIFGDLRDALHRATVCCFFFQAEDGIRDSSVTGVQTCALPISRREGFVIVTKDSDFSDLCILLGFPRSEERRVGKDCRGGWGADYEYSRTTCELPGSGSGG